VKKEGREIKENRLQVKKNALDWLDKNRKGLIEISNRIWKYAELGMQEKKSSKTLSDWLSQEGFNIRTGISEMPTAFLAEFSSGSGSPVIGLLAEYDALPGNSNKAISRHEPTVEGGAGHGCGHNLIGTSALAAAIAIKKSIEKRNIDATIRVYGTPGEELLIGKVFMAREGLFDDCDVILTSHPGDINAASAIPSYFFISTEFTFYGESCHATSAPQSGRNALDAVQIANIAAEMRKKYMAPGTVLEYVIPDGGYQPNVVPDEAKVWYFVRHPELNGLKDAYHKILDAVKGAAVSTGTTPEERFITGCYGYLPNERLGELIYNNAKIIGPPTFTDKEKQFANEIRKNYGLKAMREPIHEDVTFLKEGMGMYSQDDGDASWINPLGKLKYAFPRGIPLHGWGYTALSATSIGHKGMMFAAKTLTATAIDILMFPDVLAEIKKEHKERTKGFQYICLVPRNVKPITGDFMNHHVKTRW
jgi:aminobenzoyl-glutamate utilization protein B